MRRTATTLLATSAIAMAASANGCRVGRGTGSVTGDLYVPDCWSGKFDLQPDFFAATPNENDDSLFIRIQRGSDYINFSDGISLLVTHVTEIRTTMLGQALPVSLPPAVVPPGVPITADPSPTSVQFALFLQGTCRPETPGIYAMDSVTTSGSGVDGGVECGADTAAAAAQCGPTAPPTTTGTSTITFQHLFDASLAEAGDPGALRAGEGRT